MRQIVELSRSYMQGYRANQGDFDLDEARLLRSTEHVSVLLLNFGDINRTPHFNGRQPLSRELVETDQYAVLPHYLVRNTAHLTILLEANGIERHRELFNQYQCLCVMAVADGESPAIAAVCSTDNLVSSRLELIRRIELEGKRLARVAHAATFRVIWGKVEESTDGGITDDRGVRKNLRVALEEGADPADNMEVIVCPDSLAVAQASTTYIEAEPVDAEALFHECPIFRTGSLNDCKRMRMPELRVCAFHINAHAFQQGITAGKNAIMKILILESMGIDMKGANSKFRHVRALAVVQTPGPEYRTLVEQGWGNASANPNHLEAFRGRSIDRDKQTPFSKKFGPLLYKQARATKQVPCQLLVAMRSAFVGIADPNYALRQSSCTGLAKA